MAALYGAVSGLASFVAATVIGAVRAAVPWWRRARLDRRRAVLPRQRGGHVVSPKVVAGSGMIGGCAVQVADATETPPGSPPGCRKSLPMGRHRRHPFSTSGNGKRDRRGTN